MPITTVIGSMISSIIINIISNDLSDVKTNIVQSYRIKKSNKRLRKWIEDFIKNNDGTILTTSVFERYIKYQKPIEKIYNYVFEVDSSDLDNNTFIAECVNECKEYITANGKTIVLKDELVIKEFFFKFLNHFIRF